MNPFDEFLSTYAAPVLKQAGFRRLRREFALDGPRGFTGVVGFYPDALPESMGFSFQYGVVTPSLIDRHRAVGVPIPSWLSPSEALLMVQVFAPDWQRKYFDPYRWALGDVAVNDQLASELRAALTGEVIPNIQRWFDPRELAAAIEPHQPGRFPAGKSAAAVAMALCEAGLSIDLDRALARLPQDDAARIWIEARLAAPR